MSEVIPSCSVVINTCCLSQRRLELSSGEQPYSFRYYLLANLILPLYTRWLKEMFREVVVVGEYIPGDGYTYVPCESTYKSCVDALYQRQAGFEALKNHAVQWVVFQHDDHLFDPLNVIHSTEYADVLSPSRWTHLKPAKTLQLNDGSWPENKGNPYNLGYLNGHACVMRTSVLRNGFKWTDCAHEFTWDVSATQILKERNLRVRYAPDLKCWDMELGSQPWL